MKLNQKEWAMFIALSLAFGGWLFRMERLTTKLVQQGEYSTEQHAWAEKNIEALDKRVDGHDTDIKLLQSKSK